MKASISSASLGLQNPIRPLGWARLLTATCLIGLVAVSGGIALSQPAEPTLRIMALSRCGLAILFVINLVTSGLRALLAFVPQGDVPGPLRQGAEGGRGLLEKKLITGTYKQPTSLMGLLIHHNLPRFAFLTAPHRHAMKGIGFRLFLLTVSIVAACSVSWTAIWVALVLVVELIARWTAIVVANPKEPSTSGVRECCEHLGDKGDPVGLFHHLRQVCEKYRIDSLPNRNLVESAPHIAEHVSDARIAGEYFVETQPLPVNTSRNDGLVLAVAGVLLATLGWGLLLLTPLTKELTTGTIIALGAGLYAIVASSNCFRLAFLCYAGMRFHSDLFLIRMRGTYNTTRVGSQFQRSSFQSDLYLDVFSARIISELALNDAPLSLGWRIDEVLRSSRLIVTVLDEELIASRNSELVRSARTYQDQASFARTTDLSSPEYAQHLMRLQAESFIAAQAGMQGNLTANPMTQLVRPSIGSVVVPTLPHPASQPPSSISPSVRPSTTSPVIVSTPPPPSGNPPRPPKPMSNPPPKPIPPPLSKNPPPPPKNPTSKPAPTTQLKRIPPPPPPPPPKKQP